MRTLSRRCLVEKGSVSGLDPDRHGAAGGIPTVTHCNLDASQRWGAWRRWRMLPEAAGSIQQQHHANANVDPLPSLAAQWLLASEAPTL